jgi:aryl-alcohol dehydrogenase-like predicted oxidoreductase
MRYRKLGSTDLTLSEIGFGAWTIGADWWGHIDDDSAIRMLQRALDLGITYYDTADQYGQGRSEQLIGRAFKGRRDRVVIGGKFGYDFYNNPPSPAGEHKEMPQNFDPAFIRFALEQTLSRLDTDYLDLWLVHNARMNALDDGAIWQTLDDLKREGKIREYGVALGPAIGWRDEGLRAMQEREIGAMQIIYNLLEQEPGTAFFPVAEDRGVGLLVRVPHSSGLLEGKYTLETTFDASDHRSFRKREWLVEGLQKLEQLRFLTDGRPGTIGQVALRFCLAQPTVTTVLPNLYDMDQLEEFAAASDVPDLTADDLGRIQELYAANFGVEAAPASSASR